MYQYVTLCLENAEGKRRENSRSSESMRKSRRKMLGGSKRGKKICLSSSQLKNQEKQRSFFFIDFLFLFFFSLIFQKKKPLEKDVHVSILFSKTVLRIPMEIWNSEKLSSCSSYPIAASFGFSSRKNLFLSSIYGSIIFHSTLNISPF